LTVTCPPIEAQRRIGALFRAIDAQISAHRQMVEEAAAAVRVKVGERLVDGSLFLRQNFAESSARRWCSLDTVRSCG
jgi:hypothetical protein